MRISIITINYNNKEGLGNTMSSVIDQDFKEFEYIVIDGNSHDGSKAMIEANKSNISYWVSEKDSGIYNAMNKGIVKATGQYLLFLNSGDYLCDKEVLSEVNECLNGHDLYYGNIIRINDGSGKNNKVTFPEKLNFNFFLNSGYLPHAATFFKKSLFENLYLYNENFKIVGDWDFLISAICKYNATYQYLNLDISYYDKTGISSDPNFRQLHDSEIKQSLQTHFGAYLEDYERLNFLIKQSKSKRIRKLIYLENFYIARVLNNFWLLGLKLIFSKFKI